MPVEQFTRAQFEAALPIHNKTGLPLWMSLGLLDGEYCYLLPVTVHAGLLIRSSVKRNGMSADTGDDSIRILIVRIGDLAATGSKLQKYTTRLPGWQARMTGQLRQLWSMARETGPCTAVHNGIVCAGWIGIYKCRTEANRGRLFRKCSEQIHTVNGLRNCFFEWVTPKLPSVSSVTSVSSKAQSAN